MASGRLSLPSPFIRGGFLAVAFRCGCSLFLFALLACCSWCKCCGVFVVSLVCTAMPNLASSGPRVFCVGGFVAWLSNNNTRAAQLVMFRLDPTACDTPRRPTGLVNATDNTRRPFATFSPSAPHTTCRQAPTPLCMPAQHGVAWSQRTGGHNTSYKESCYIDTRRPTLKTQSSTLVSHYQATVYSTFQSQPHYQGTLQFTAARLSGLRNT